MSYFQAMHEDFSQEDHVGVTAGAGGATGVSFFIRLICLTIKR
jgi:hypothetical protein